MEKEKYIELIKKLNSEKAQAALLKQLDNFYALKDLQLNNAKYAVDDDVILPADTFLQGFGNDTKFLENYAKEGLISPDFETEYKEKKINYAVRLWHIHKKIKLYDYIKFYSGMTFSWKKDKIKIVPYGELDSFVETLRNEKYFSLKAETTMEARFLPSLQKNGQLPKKGEAYNLFDGCCQLALILNGRDKKCQALVKNNLLDERLPLDIVFEFMHLKHPEHLEAFKKNRLIGEDERIAYILFGLPANMIEGVFVGRLYENNKKVLSLIQKVLPNRYVCNLDGKVIIGNK